MADKLMYSINNIIICLLLLFTSSCDCGMTNTAGPSIHIDIRCDYKFKNDDKKFRVIFLSNKDILNGQIIPNEIYGKSWTYSIFYYKESSKLDILGSNKDIFSFVNDADNNLYIFYTLYGASSRKKDAIDYSNSLKSVGFNPLYVDKLINIYNEEDNNNLFISKDSTIFVTTDSIEMKYIDRFSLYDKLIDKGYPYIKKLNKGEEYILSWH